MTWEFGRPYLHIKRGLIMGYWGFLMIMCRSAHTVGSGGGGGVLVLFWRHVFNLFPQDDKLLDTFGFFGGVAAVFLAPCCSRCL